MAGFYGYAFSVPDRSKAPNGETLLQYVRQKNIKKTTSALVALADPNFQDPKTGDTALHVAVSAQSRVLVKLLIVFDANLTLKNRQDLTPLDLAQQESATDIAGDIKNILDLQKELDADKPKTRHRLWQRAAAKPEEILLLSLDGGGIRGLVSVQVLLEMEKRRKKLYPDSHTLLSRFNWMTGNSTGGIAALAFAAAKADVLQSRRLYFQLKDEVLGGTPPFPSETVDKVFKEIYGTSATMSSIKETKVSVMTTLANQSPPVLHIMSNYGGARNGQLPPEKQLVWKAARATSAVPIKFHPQEDESHGAIYVDGGLIANNPTTDAIVDMFEYAKQENQKVKLKLVLSLGTGLNKPTPIDDVDFDHSKLGDLIVRIARHLGMQKLGERADDLLLILNNCKAFKQLLQILTAQITQPNGEVVKRSEFLCEVVGAHYFRINPPISDHISAFTTDDTQIIEMLYEVVYFMLKNCREKTDRILEYIFQ